MKFYNIDTIFDIGANIGQYAMLMRIVGYKGKIISFEPLITAFSKLKRNSLRDNNWEVNNYGIGDIECRIEINVSDNSYSSSFLDINKKHTESAPQSKYIDKQWAEVKKLSSVYGQFCTDESGVMVKIDTQGFEKNVIDGAEDVLSKIKLIQLEMSLIELYANEMLYLEMIQNLNSKGFTLISLENGFSDPNSGELLQVDGIFINEKFIAKS